MQNYAKDGGQVVYPNSGSDISAGDVVVLGNGQLGVAVVDIASGAEGIVATAGNFTIAKAAEAIAFGDVLYYDAAGPNLTKTKATDLPRFGVATAAAASGDDYVQAEINVPGTAGVAAAIDSGDGTAGQNYLALQAVIAALEEAGIVLPA